MYSIHFGLVAIDQEIDIKVVQKLNSSNLTDSVGKYRLCDRYNNFSGDGRSGTAKQSPQVTK